MTDILFTPATISELALPNRIVMSAMTRGFSPGGVPGPDVAAYYRARARGGVGLVITEAVAVARGGAAEQPGIPGFSEAAEAGWRAVVTGVQAAGGRIAAQLHHAGTIRQAETSAVPEAQTDDPAAMSSKDIDDTIAAFAGAAASARRLGFDAVEIHGANGNLIDQFFWARSNIRSDHWGGSLEGRARFAVAVTSAVRDAMGPDFPILFRFSQFKQQDYAAHIAETPEELGLILGWLVDAGVDGFHASQRRFWEPAFQGSALNLAGWAKRLTGKPAIAVGSVGLKGPDIGDLLAGQGANAGPAGLDDLRRRVANREFDLVAVGRALLTDPEWANKVRDGRLDDLRGFNLASLGSLVIADPAAAQAA